MIIEDFKSDLEWKLAKYYHYVKLVLLKWNLNSSFSQVRVMIMY